MGRLGDSPLPVSSQVVLDLRVKWKDSGDEEGSYVNPNLGVVGGWGWEGERMREERVWRAEAGGVREGRPGCPLRQACCSPSVELGAEMALSQQPPTP